MFQDELDVYIVVFDVLRRLMYERSNPSSSLSSSPRAHAMLADVIGCVLELGQHLQQAMSHCNKASRPSL